MGHYDNDRDERRAEAARIRDHQVELLAKRTGLPVLEASKLEPLGVCAECAKLVYSLPNWGCDKSGMTCPHKPRSAPGGFW